MTGKDSSRKQALVSRFTQNENARINPRSLAALLRGRNGVPSAELLAFLTRLVEEEEPIRVPRSSAGPAPEESYAFSSPPELAVVQQPQKSAKKRADSGSSVSMKKKHPDSVSQDSFIQQTNRSRKSKDRSTRPVPLPKLEVESEAKGMDSVCYSSQSSPSSRSIRKSKLHSKESKSCRKKTSESKTSKSSKKNDSEGTDTLVQSSTSSKRSKGNSAWSAQPSFRSETSKKKISACPSSKSLPAHSSSTSGNECTKDEDFPVPEPHSMCPETLDVTGNDSSESEAAYPDCNPSPESEPDYLDCGVVQDSRVALNVSPPKCGTQSGSVADSSPYYPDGIAKNGSSELSNIGFPQCACHDSVSSSERLSTASSSTNVASKVSGCPNSEESPDSSNESSRAASIAASSTTLPPLCLCKKCRKLVFVLVDRMTHMCCKSRSTMLSAVNELIDAPIQVSHIFNDMVVRSSPDNNVDIETEMIPGDKRDIYTNFAFEVKKCISDDAVNVEILIYTTTHDTCTSKCNLVISLSKVIQNAVSKGHKIVVMNKEGQEFAKKLGVPIHDEAVKG